MSKINACAAEVINQFKTISEDELKEYAKDVLSLANRDKELKGMAAIARAREKVNDEFRSAFFEDAQTAINNEEKLLPFIEQIKNKLATLRDIVGIRWKNKGNNIEISQKAAHNRVLDMAFGKLSPEDIVYLQNKENQMHIADVFDGYKPSKLLSSEDAAAVKRISDNLKEYISESEAAVVTSGALPLRFAQNRRYLGAIHDRAMMLKGGRNTLWSNVKNMASLASNESKTKWREVIKSKINMEETFEKTEAMLENGTIDMAKADSILERIFDNIMNGRSDIFTKSAVINDAEAVANRSRMFFVYKDMKSFLEYNDVYGQGDLFKAMMHDAGAKGRSIGRSEILGSNPDIAYAKLRQAQLEHDPKKPRWHHNTDLFYKEVRGDSSAAVDPTLANIGSNIRTATTMARLATLLISSLTDANMAAAYLRKWGANYGKSFINQFDTVLRPASTEERRRIGKMFHIDLKSHIGYMGKFSEAQGTGELMNKLSNKFFRANGMHGWDGGNRTGAMTGLSVTIGEHSAKNFDSLPGLIKYQFGKHGIGNDEWEVLRKYTTDDFFALDNVEKLTNDDLLKLYNARSGKTPMYQLKNEIYRKVYSMFEAAQENAILTPNAWIRTLMNQGTVTGTWAGEAMRMFSQFKGFPMSYMDRALLEGFHDAQGMGAKFYYALQQFGFIVPLSYLSTWAYFLSQGKSMPDIDEMNWGEGVAFAAGIMAPGFGIFSGILDPNNQNQNLISSALLTPAIRLLSNTASIPLSLVAGNPDQALKNLSKSVQYAVPLTTLPVASPYIKAFLGEEPYLLPGQEQLYGGQ